MRKKKGIAVKIWQDRVRNVYWYTVHVDGKLYAENWNAELEDAIRIVREHVERYRKQYDVR